MQVTELMNVPFALLLLGAAEETGLLSAWQEGTFTANELAEKLSLDGRAVQRVSEALAALGFLNSSVMAGNTVYTLSDEARRIFYDPAAEGYTGLAFMHRYNMLKSWLKLPEVLRTGQPCQRLRDRKNNAYFMAAMRYGARESAPRLAEFLVSLLPSQAEVLDVGGGPLNYARPLVERGFKVTVLDLPAVVEMMQPEAERWGIKMIAGDFTQGLPEGPFDAVFLGNITHIIGKEENRELIERVAGVLKIGGIVIIMDFIRGINPHAAVFGVNMLINTPRGDTYTLTDYENWLTSTGFKDVRLHDISGRQVIIASLRHR